MDEHTTGYRIVHGGFSWRIPILEKGPHGSVHNAHRYWGQMPTHRGTPHRRRDYKRKGVLGAADFAHCIQGFQGQDTEEIRRVAKESLILFVVFHTNDPGRGQ